MKINKLLLILLMIISTLLILIPTSNAALQSNGGTVATKNIDNWIVQIRQMEALGGTLGLSETINKTGLLATTDSNGLDCHMQKNTEYGAMVILSASSYGNPSKIASGDTTTGNATGVKMNINKEWVAAGAGLTRTTYAKNVDSRYINNDYEAKYVTTPYGKQHVGDAMNIGTWHSGTDIYWFSAEDCGGMLRAYSGSIFSYYGYAYLTGSSSHSNDATYNKPWASRAVVVVGEGI